MHRSLAVEIAAPPQVVWDVTANVERWHEWTGSITSVEWVQGHGLALGNVARIKQPMQSAALWTVTHLEPGHYFSWTTTNMGSTFVGAHRVEPAEGGTLATLIVDASGLGSTILWPMLTLALPRSLKMEAEGLKARSEELARGNAS